MASTIDSGVFAPLADHRFEIDGSVQPIAFVVGLDHGLVDRNVIR